MSPAFQWPHNVTILCNPNPENPTKSLDALLLRFAPFFRQNHDLLLARVTSPENLLRTREFAISMDEEFATWSSTLPDAWMPKTVGHLSSSRSKEQTIYPLDMVNRIDVYFDCKHTSSLDGSAAKADVILSSN